MGILSRIKEKLRRREPSEEDYQRELQHLRREEKRLSLEERILRKRKRIQELKAKTSRGGGILGVLSGLQAATEGMLKGLDSYAEDLAPRGDYTWDPLLGFQPRRTKRRKGKRRR